jgi:hypothetical protein
MDGGRCRFAQRAWCRGPAPGEAVVRKLVRSSENEPVSQARTPQDVAIVYLAGAGFIIGTVLECAGGANLTVGAVAGLAGSRARPAADSMLFVHRCFPITPPPRS